MDIASDQHNKYQTTLIHSEDEFYGLEKEWKNLFQESNATVFQSFEWIGTWWKYFGKGKELWCIIVRHQSELIGIVPMFMDHPSFVGIPIAKRLQCIGRPLSDYLDIISKPGQKEIITSLFAEFLSSVKNKWDVFDFEEIPEHSDTVSLLTKYLHAQKMHVYRLPGPPCPIINLPETFDKFLQNLGPNTRAGYRRKLKLLHNEFSVQHQTRCALQENIRDGIEKFVKIHERRWKGLGFPSAFDDPNHKEFHITVAEKFAERNWLRLFLIDSDGETIAASLEFNYKNRIYMYQSNAAASFNVMRYSPGLLIKMDAIKHGIHEGMSVYDLLRGDEHYKYDNLKAVATNNSMLRIAGNGFRAKVRFWCYLIFMFSSKMLGRSKLEWYEYKRFIITKKPLFIAKIAYLIERIQQVFKIGLSFISDHLFHK